MKKILCFVPLALALSGCTVVSIDPCSRQGAYQSGYDDGQFNNMFQNHYARSCPPGRRRMLNRAYANGYRDGHPYYVGGSGVTINVFSHHRHPHHHPYHPGPRPHPHHPHPHPHHNHHPVGPGGTQHLIGPGGNEHLLGPGGTQNTANKVSLG